MKRKQFIKRAALLGTGVLLSSKIPAWAQTEVKSSFKDFFGNSTSKQKEIPRFRVSLNLKVDTINFFTKATAEDKVLNLKIFLLDENDEVISKYYSANYFIQSSVEIKNTNSYNVIAIRKEETLKAAKLPIEFDWNKIKFNFLFNNQSPLYIIDFSTKSGFGNIRLEQPAEDECFITSACVSAMGKTDICDELLQLRTFRNDILLSNENGKMLVKKYYEIAPKIVTNINNLKDSKKIYTTIYNEMILPTLENINLNKYENAIHIYEDFTYNLEKKYGH